MRDLVIEKGSPFAFIVIVAWYLDTPRNMLRAVLFEVCVNMGQFFAMLADFFS